MPHAPTPPPVASCRLQLTPSFGFDAAAALCADIARLGVSHLYLSPIAEAIPGSTHGYDVVDHRTIRAEFGGVDGLHRLLDAAAEHGLAVLVDHVPNHVSVERADLNAPWWQTLREGPDSTAASWFDVDWELTNGRIIVPKLGEPLDDVLKRDGLQIADGDLGPEIRYGPLRFPLAPGTEHLAIRDALDAQHYLLTWWRDARRNVRRFFTIDDLVAVRVETPGVADVVDTIPRMLCDHDAFGGVRVDHVDGLAAPGAYLAGLREMIGARWLLVEKIVAPGETLPRSWPVDGTTGYEHVRVAEHTLLDSAAEVPLGRLWTSMVGPHRADFDTLEHSARREVLERGLRPDLDRLVRTVIGRRPKPATETGGDAPVDTADDAPVDTADGTAHDTWDDCRQAIVETTLALDRYRTYLPADPASTLVLERAQARARDARPDLGVHIDRFVDLVRRDDVVRTRWQQMTGPVMAKGAEDRAFYRHQRLSALCEVGGDPGRWTTNVTAFHEHQRRTQSGWPTTLLASTTHDTKRSDAVRARSLALAAAAVDWARFVREWAADNDALACTVDPADLQLAMQTMATSSPITTDRLGAYLVKAAREADTRTHWEAPDEGYESALRGLASALASPADGRWSSRLARPGGAIGLRLLALQLTCPGVADLYQGAPLELTSMVDPDNRRPPDWDRWRRTLDAVTETDTVSAWRAGEIDLARMVMTRRLLHLRRRRAAAFGASAGYVELRVDGAASADVVAFSRTDGATPNTVTIVTRATSALLDEETVIDAAVLLPTGSWRSVLADDAQVVPGGSCRLAPIVTELGVAVLERTDA